MSKIKFKYRVVSIIIICIVILISIIYRNINQKSIQKMFFSMDTIITIDTKNQEVLDSIQTKIEELNQIFDRHSHGTTLNILNNDRTIKSDVLTDLIIETYKLNDIYGYDVNIASGNLVDAWNISENPTIPTSSEISQALESISIDNIKIVDDNITLLNDTTIDIGAVAKGYTLDIIKSQLDTFSLNIEDTIISMGSSMLLYNVKDYPILVRSPNNTQELACKFSIDGIGYISTSGGYERYIEIDNIKYPHILDLSTGYPSNTDLTSVTVFTDSGIKSDFLSTYIFMGGTENLKKYINNEDYKIIAIDNNNNIYISDGLDVQIKDNSFKLSKN